MTGSYAQIEIEARFLIHFHKNGRRGCRLKTITLRRNGVRPGLEIIDAVASECVGDCRPDKTRRIASSLNGDASDKGGLFVANIAKQASGGYLRITRQYEQYQADELWQADEKCHQACCPPRPGFVLHLCQPP
jgi:hypothetical protein